MKPRFSMASYTDQTGRGIEWTQKSADTLVADIRRNINRLYLNKHGKTPIVLPPKTPQWVVNKINATAIAYVVAEKQKPAWGFR